MQLSKVRFCYLGKKFIWRSQGTAARGGLWGRTALYNTAFTKLAKMKVGSDAS
jgi:hypothetical protein